MPEKLISGTLPAPADKDARPAEKTVYSPAPVGTPQAEEYAQGTEDTRAVSNDAVPARNATEASSLAAGTNGASSVLDVTTVTPTGDERVDAPPPPHTSPASEVPRWATGLRAPVIEGEGKTFYGFSQRWLHTKAARGGGCSSAAAADALFGLAAHRDEVAFRLGLALGPGHTLPLVQAKTFLERVYRAVGSIELGPKSFGRSVAGYVSGTLKFGLAHGLPLQDETMFTSGASREEALRFIRRGLRTGAPVTLLTTLNTHELRLYRKGPAFPSSPHKGGEKNPRGAIRRHFMSIVGIRRSAGGKTLLILCTWGQLAFVELDALLASWQGLGSYGSALVWFRPTSDEAAARRRAATAFTLLAEAPSALLRVLKPGKEEQE